MVRADSEGTERGSARRTRGQSRPRRFERRGSFPGSDLERRIRTSLEERAEPTGRRGEESPGPANRVQERIRDLL